MITHGTIHEFNEIMECMMNSRLCDAYFSDRSHREAFISAALNRNELYVYKDENGGILGMMRIDMNGMLSRFPLLRLISINSKSRNKGIGTAMLEHFEKIGFEGNNKVFLCVSDFNKRAQKLYKGRGYRRVGKIGNLYKENVDEYIMMKLMGNSS